jgi:hypothetical protein
MTARTDDYDEIVRVVQLYIDGFNDNEASKFREAFHEDAWIFYIDADGNLHRNLISESFEKWAMPPRQGRGGSVHLGDSGGRCRLRPAQLRHRLGQIQWLDRLSQSAPDQGCLEDHEQDRHSQHQVDSTPPEVRGKGSCKK